MAEKTETQTIQKNREKFDHRNKERAVFRADKGLSEKVIRQISEEKDEPQWMLEKRLESLKCFNEKPMPKWGPDLSELDIDAITPYVKADDTKARDWDEVPEDIKDTFDRLGVPEAEKKALAGAGGQYESTVVYQNLKDKWEKKGVIFMDMDQAVQKHPELVREHFMEKCVPPDDNKFSALHGALWSGGSFVYVPEGVEVEIPVQAYFRMNSKGMGQFEHTLIVADDNSRVHYIEGCSAPTYSRNNLHAGCVEVFVNESAHVQYSTVQNWSRNTYNLNTKRAIVQKNATMEWVSGSMGSKVTMLYPCSGLVGEGAKANHISIAFAGKGQNIDTGAKIYHLAPNTSSTIESKSISQKGGRTNYRGLVTIAEGAKNASSKVDCDALMFDSESTSDTEPYVEVEEETADVAHEATVGKLSEETIYYLMSRGIPREEAAEMIVRGFIEPLAKELPLEYAVELNRLIQLEMEGGLG
ncbi:MAG: Fe-S cluster assembly protein SufB [Candidatus Nanohaloarchaea archaeon]|nr:Fe-S cluster assembly protein SufB [Candidatus Nanohaloarchaea archaeon]